MVQRTALIIEDDEAVQVALRHTMEAEGFNVRVCSDGGEALDLLDHIPLPQLILCDLSMHPVDGREFLQRKNQNPILRNIPVIVVSGEANTRDLVGQVNAIIAKPFSVEVLHAAIAGIFSS